MDKVDKVFLAVFFVALLVGVAGVLLAGRSYYEFNRQCREKGGEPVQTRTGGPLCLKPGAIIK